MDGEDECLTPRVPSMAWPSAPGETGALGVHGDANVGRAIIELAVAIAALKERVVRVEATTDALRRRDGGSGNEPRR